MAEAAPEPTNYDTSNVQWNTMNWNSILGGSSTPAAAGPTPAAAAPAVKSPAPASPSPAGTPSPAPASGGSGGSGSSGSFGSSGSSGSCSGAKFGGQSASQGSTSSYDYSGNIGSPPGSNIIEVCANDVNNFKHTITFKTAPGTTKARKIVFWNKGGNEQGGTNVGSFQTSTPAHQFMLQPNAEVYIAIDDNSQGGWCDWTDGKTTGSGQFDCAWGEFDFGDSGNGAWSGFDVSKIVQNSSGGGPCNIRIDNSDGQYSSCDHNEYEHDDPSGAQDAVIGVKLNAGNTRMTATHGGW